MNYLSKILTFGLTLFFNLVITHLSAFIFTVDMKTQRLEICFTIWFMTLFI